jgi:hypothetical protein
MQLCQRTAFEWPGVGTDDEPQHECRLEHGTKCRGQVAVELLRLGRSKVVCSAWAGLVGGWVGMDGGVSLLDGSGVMTLMLSQHSQKGTRSTFRWARPLPLRETVGIHRHHDHDDRSAPSSFISIPLLISRITSVVTSQKKTKIDSECP